MTTESSPGQVSPQPNGTDDLIELNARRRSGRQSSAEGGASNAADAAVLDAFAHLEQEILDDDDGDEPAGREEAGIIPVVKKLPKFVPFRVNPLTVFDLWATTETSGVDTTVLGVSREFAPQLEEEDEGLRRCRFYESVTEDGVVRLITNFLPDADSSRPNTWLASKKAGLELAMTCWVTMRTKLREQRYAFRRVTHDLGEPRFSGYSRGQLIEFALRRPGLFIEDASHRYYKKAAGLSLDE
jgi:hypothetical protein